MPFFDLAVADLEDGEKQIDWPIPESWLADVLAGTEATPGAAAGRVSVRLRKEGREVMVRGWLETAVVMPCARTLDPVDVPVKADIFLLLSPGSVDPPRGRPLRAARRDAAQKQKEPRARRREAAETENLSDEDAAQDTYSGDRIVLDRYLREFILLELPLMPLRSGAPPAIGPSPGSPGASLEPAIDPRLAPLAELASRLRKQE